MAGQTPHGSLPVLVPHGASEALLPPLVGFVVAIALLCFVGLTTPAVAQSDAASDWPPRIEFATVAPVTAELRSHIADDRLWIAKQPAARLTAPPADSLAAVRTWLDAALARDAASAGTSSDVTVTGARDLLSLLRDRWLERGYLAARVELHAVIAAEMTIRIEPGPAYAVGSVDVAGDDFSSRDMLLDTYLPRQGDRFIPGHWEVAAERLLAGAGEQGYPFARWVLEEVSLDHERARVHIEARLLPGNSAFIGPIVSDLPNRRGERFLIRASGMHRGQRFQNSRLEQARRSLFARDLYVSVDEPTVFSTSAVDTVGIYWTVTPRKRPNRFSVILGLSQRGDEANRLSGQVDLSLPNLAGTGRKLAAHWSDDGRQLTRFGIYYLEPLIFGTPLDTDIRVDSEVQTDIYSRLTLENRWQLPIVGYWGLELGAGWDRTTFPVGSLARTGRLRGRAAFYHRRGDRMQSGWHGYAAIETARREATYRQDSDGEQETSKLGEVTFQRILDLNGGGELWLGPVISLAGRAAFQQLNGGDEPAPLSEQFRFGGARTLRGYRESQFHGETVAYGGVELRLGRAERSRVYTFVDLGYFEFVTLADVAGNIVRQRNRGRPIGFGVGLEVTSGVGDISLAIGFPERVDFQDAKLHVALLEAF